VSFPGRSEQGRVQGGGGARAVRRGRFAASAGQPCGARDRFDETGRGEHLTAEAGPAEGGAPHGLVHTPGLAEGELGRAEGGGEAGARGRRRHVRGRRRGFGRGRRPATGRRRTAPSVPRPRRRRAVRTKREGHSRGRGSRAGRQRGERDRDDPHTGVAAGFAVSAQLLQVWSGDVGQAGLLGEFAPGGRLSADSAGCTNPPGNAHCPVYGSDPCSTSRTCGVSARAVRTASWTVTAKGSWAYLSQPCTLPPFFTGGRDWLR
jgi:hypothetical protein